jgi:RNA polymerase sigma factor (sigma-70 family)
MDDLLKLTDSERAMVEKNLPFVTFVAKRYFSKTDFKKNQDILQEGILAMCNAIKRYDPEKAKFTTYMHPTIDGHLKRFVGYRDRIIPIPHQKHLKQETQDKAVNAKIIYSLDMEISGHMKSQPGAYITLLDMVPDEKNMDLESNTVNRLCISDAIKSLEWKEKLVIIYRYYFDLNQATIGRLMWLSQVHVHRIERKALKNMKLVLTK